MKESNKIKSVARRKPRTRSGELLPLILNPQSSILKHSVPPNIELKNIKLSYHDLLLFDNFNLSIPSQKWLCLLGQSGIGKSTLLRIIADLITDKETHILNVDIKTSDNLPLTDRMAYMAQQDLLLPWLSVLDNVLLGYKIRGKKIPKNIYDKANELLKKAGLEKATKKMPHTLSGGMKQRAALVRTLIEDRPIVLMDEPFSALDSVTRYRLQNLAAELLKNKTVILVTHDPLEALRLSDVIYVLSGTPAFIKETISPQDMAPRDINNVSIQQLYAHLLNELNDAYVNVE